MISIGMPSDQRGPPRMENPEQHGKELYDTGVEQRLNEWVMLSRSKALAACGRTFEARNEALRTSTAAAPAHVKNRVQRACGRRFGAGLRSSPSTAPAASTGLRSWTDAGRGGSGSAVTVCGAGHRPSSRCGRSAGPNRRRGRSGRTIRPRARPLRGASTGRTSRG